MAEHIGLQEVRRRLEGSPSVEKEEAKELLIPICEALRIAGVTRIQAYYEGYADSGAVEDMTIEPADVQLVEDLRELIDDWIAAVLPAGWEINEGSQGNVTIDVASCSAHFDHETKSVEYEPFDIE